ncbi:unnamed protein product [Closterium sp. Naga37s-1]|nr:unnamed protein product [Closterium sp. Naga37s-1]
MAITGENSCGDDDDDALYAATEMLEARTGLDFLVSALSHEKEKPGPVASVANTGEASGLCRGEDRPQPAHTAKPAVPSAAGPSVRLPSRASSSKPPPRYKQAVLRWADPTDPGRPLADAGESVNHVTPTPSNSKKPSLTTLIYEEALETFKSTWSTDYPWLILIKNTAGMPAFKCRLCIDFAGDGGKCGKSGHGATDLQTQAFKRHAATNKHQLAINHQKQMLAQAGKQPRIDEHTLAKDDETTRVISLLNSLHFTTQNHLPMETWVRLVRYMAQNEVRGFPKKGYGTYYTTEALAAKDAAESLPEFGMVDSFIRWLSTYLGSSGPWHQRFLDLQEVFTQTNLELQGINDVRWLSRGDAVCRLLAVLPGVVVMVHELGNKPMYQMVTSYRFQFMLRFLADVLEQLNVLSKTFQHRQIDLLAIQGQIRRTTTHINSRYVDCGDDFGGGLSEKLSPFIARHGPNGVRRVEVEWVDSDGRPTSHCYVLHDSPLEGYPIAGTHERCVEQCTAMAEALVHNLDERLGSLDKLSGVKLFMPDEWPHGRQERSMPDWAEVVKIWRAYKKRKPITTVAAPKKQPSAKGKEKVDEDDAGGAGSGWGTETPVHRHGSMSDGGGSDEDEDMCVM